MRSLASAVAYILVIALAAASVGCSKKSGEGANADSLAAAKSAAEHIVVKVNGKRISRLDIERQEDALLTQLRNFADSAQIASMMPTIRQQAADNAVNRVLLEGAIKNLGIKADKAMIDARIEMYRRNFVSQEAYEADLAKNGMNESRFRGEVEMALQAEELFKRRTAGVMPATEEEGREFYDKNPEQFMQPERVRASHILVKVEQGDSEAVRAQKRKKIDGILAAIKKGADFADQARNNSDCPSKAQGGDLGYFERGDMVPEFETAAFGLKSGQTSGIVQTQFGYHIIKTTDHAKPSPVPFDQAKQQLMTFIGEQKKQQAIAAYFDSLRTSAKIEYLDSTYVQ